jgi:hypothetical protein
MPEPGVNKEILMVLGPVVALIVIFIAALFPMLRTIREPERCGSAMTKGRC